MAPGQQAELGNRCQRLSRRESVRGHQLSEGAGTAAASVKAVSWAYRGVGLQGWALLPPTGLPLPTLQGAAPDRPAAARSALSAGCCHPQACCCPPCPFCRLLPLTCLLLPALPALQAAQRRRAAAEGGGRDLPHLRARGARAQHGESHPSTQCVVLIRAFLSALIRVRACLLAARTRSEACRLLCKPRPTTCLCRSGAAGNTRLGETRAPAGAVQRQGSR